MVIYGTPDADTTAVDVLMKHVESMDVKYIMHYPRVSVDARPCRLPLSLKVQAVLTNGVVITCFQPRPGANARIQ